MGSRWRISVGGLLLLVLVVLVDVPLLAFNYTDGSYTCRAGALVDVLSPEPEMGADFRRNVAFDSGYACNQTAGRRVEVAGILLAGSLVIYLVRSFKPRRASNS